LADDRIGRHARWLQLDLDPKPAALDAITSLSAASKYLPEATIPV
jgi:hypothetical protein